MSGSSNTTIHDEVSGVKFTDGSVLSGHWTVSYDSSGAIDSITDADFIVSGSGGTTEFTNAYVLSYANPDANGIYQVAFRAAQGSQYQSLYLDWQGEAPSSLYGGPGSNSTNVTNNATGENVSLQDDGSVSTSGAPDTTIHDEFSGVKFTDGSVLSGHWTVSYDSSGAIDSITDADFIVSGSGGTTEFTNAYVLSYANPDANGIYQVAFGGAQGDQYQSLYLDWQGEAPSSLYGGPGSDSTVVTNSATGEKVSLQDDGSVSNSVACYVRGTKIGTPCGSRPVEALTIGDDVMTMAGAKPIRWIGRRSYAGRFLHGNATVLPIRIKANALAKNIPCRDLYVSPKHAMFIDGILVPAEALCNGASIFQVEAIESVEYFHLEFDKHYVIFAEGAASESYVDDNNRGMFQNAQACAVSRDDRLAGPAAYCAPRLESGDLVEEIRHAIAVRATPGPRLAASSLGELRGFVEPSVDGELHGWAQNGADPEIPVCLELVQNERIVAIAVADRYRADLLAAGLGSGNHAFRIILPDALRATGMVGCQVRRALDKAELSWLESTSSADTKQQRLVA